MIFLRVYTKMYFSFFFLMDLTLEKVYIEYFVRSGKIFSQAEFVGSFYV